MSKYVVFLLCLHPQPPSVALLAHTSRLLRADSTVLLSLPILLLSPCISLNPLPSYPSRLIRPSHRLTLLTLYAPTPSSRLTLDLRAFFEHHIEVHGFDVFHYRHRAERVQSQRYAIQHNLALSVRSCCSPRVAY